MNRELAKITAADIEIHRGGAFLAVTFDYDGAGQTLMRHVHAGYIYNVLAAVGVSKLSDLRGKSCWVTSTISSITKMEPLHRSDGIPFDIAVWEAALAAEESKKCL